MTNKRALEIYVHIPFCARKCAYCDFLSFPANARLQREYVDQLVEEIKAQGPKFTDYQVSTLFVGGGTPSLLGERAVERILAAIREVFSVGEEGEVTLEANPGTLTMEKLKAYREAGINRISLGLQSGDDKELRLLGRIHTYDDFLKTYQRVLMSGFDNVNVDLMSALPGQTLDCWKNTLKKVAMLKPEHISAYSLIIEEGTPFYQWYACGEPSAPQGGRQTAFLPPLPSEEEEREMYYFTQSYLKELGYEQYEISNFAKPGFVCRHNIGYWTGVEYLGFGLGASSYVRGCRFHNERDIQAYLRAHFQDREEFEQVLRQNFQALSLNAKMEEFMFLGLRLTKGVSQQDFAARLGHNIWDVYGKVIRQMEADGLMEEVGGFLRLTGRGIDLSNYVMSRFLLP